MHPLLNDLRARGEKIVQKQAALVYDRMKAATGVQHHSLDDLRDMDHPYATRHEGQPGHAASMTGIDPAASEINRQRGDLHAAIFKTAPKWTNNGKRVSVQVGIDYEQAPHARFVVEGTSKMIQRDFPRHILNDSRDEMSAITRQHLGRHFSGHGPADVDLGRAATLLNDIRSDVEAGYRQLYEIEHEQGE